MKCRRLLTVLVTVLVTTGSYPLALPRYSPWSAAVNLGAPINTPFSETGVSLSKHGLSLYFSSNRPCDDADGLTDVNLWVAHRTSVDAAWEEPECLLINADARVLRARPRIRTGNPRCRARPALALLRQRPSGQPRSTRANRWGHLGELEAAHLRRPRTWSEPVNLAGVNTVSREGTAQDHSRTTAGSRSCSFRPRAPDSSTSG